MNKSLKWGWLAAALVAHTPAADSPDWHRSQGAQWLNVALHGVKPLLPADLAQYLRT